ncbi:hypothetical protein C8T65DRAFT_648160 [Cerioporus squamosus]|nr:hypothetical protein C8T65DRAFT_648160 [Cerioporus squamosus]
MSSYATMVPQFFQGAQSLVGRLLPSSASSSERAPVTSSDESLSARADVDLQPGTSLHTLPEDVLLLTLSLLDPDDLVAFKRTCRFLSRVVANDARLQYRLALAASGMVDGPPSDMALGERVERLEAHRARTSPLRNPDFSCNEHVWPRSERRVQVLVCDRTVFYAVATGAGGYDVEIRSPGAAPRHLTLELREDAHFKAADLSQDLLVVGEVVMDSPKLKMHLLSIETGMPHPAAVSPWIEVECERATQSPVQIFREKVVWQRCQSDPQANRDVEVWNWQTCKLVWRHAFRPQVSYTFLDDYHLIVTAYRQEEVMIYDLCEDGTASVNRKAEPLLTLELPLGAFRCAVHYDERSRIHRSSATAGLPFVPDPALAVTAIRFSIYAPELSAALILVPGATIYEQLRITDERGLRSRKVFWHEWGPEGTLLLNMSSPHLVGRISFNTYGSRMALITLEKTSLLSRKVSLEVVVLDLSPRAVRAVRKPTFLQDRDPHRMMSGVDVRRFQFSTLRANTPHESYMGPRLCYPEGHYPTMISMDRDGFVILNEWEPPYQERSGFGYQAFTHIVRDDENY